ncbi:MAG: hypothetical protein NZL91_02485 [Thermoflexales bacterium]|nr:hypothetical protein [Thermoflexales bacterium]MCS7325076.1 hypothetical protein [Thermoflexales bacterium]MCX7938391.1 hypothetical protein [Thermoflexales bacterium]MDW8053423.1 hypothetical protein [Anaerolineae bacterium]MDW8292077.1 hypothetical protein [Anaerolineae bacterium]
MLDVRIQLSLWALASFALGILGTWLSRRLPLQPWLRTPLGLVAGELFAFGYYVGFPFLTLITGALTPPLLGLSAVGATNGVLGFSAQQWARAIGATFAAVSACLLSLWLAARDGADALEQPHSLPESARLAIYRELQWAFYRAAFVVWFGDYAGTMLATLAIAGAHAAWWRVHTPARPRMLVTLLCALFSGVMYLGARNVWLAILGQCLIRWLGERCFKHPRAAAQPRASAPQAVLDQR